MVSLSIMDLLQRLIAIGDFSYGNIKDSSASFFDESGIYRFVKAKTLKIGSVSR